MRFIEYHKEKCDECYKCLRMCPTKAIAITGKRREIVDSMCIKCGLCKSVCPQDALVIKNDRMYPKWALSHDREVVVSLAPSFVSAFDTDDPLRLITALRMLGASVVEETAIAAEYVSEGYREALEMNGKENFITTCCPSATFLIEQYYPDLLDLMIPIVSPMIAHGKILKKVYGEDAFVLFIGPCLAKKAEAEDQEVHGAIDAVITFNELNEWLLENDIDLEGLVPGAFDREATRRGCAYPMGGSLWNAEMNKRIHESKKYIRVEGSERCKDMLQTLREGKIQNYCIEMNICSGSCINGPDLSHKKRNYYEKESLLNNYVRRKKVFVNEQEHQTKLNLDFHRKFNARPVDMIKPGRDEVRKVLATIGKYTESDYLNCGACGYSTCIDKAEAAIRGLTEIDMCMPYLRSKAESFQSVIFEHSPNLICILDDKLLIQEANPAFQHVFNDQLIQVKGRHVHTFVDDEPFQEVLKTRKSIIGRKVKFQGTQKSFLINVVYLKEQHMIVSILTDITLTEKNRQELLRVKERTITACQEVIDKQMRVAQEIASLLGETTAETKVNLNRLKDVVLYDDGGIS